MSFYPRTNVVTFRRYPTTVIPAREPTYLSIAPFGTRRYEYPIDEEYFDIPCMGRQQWEDFLDPDAEWIKTVQYYAQFLPVSLDYPWFTITILINFALWLAWMLTDILVNDTIWISISFAFAHALDCILIIAVYVISVMGVQAYNRTAHIIKFLFCVFLTISQYAAIYSSLSLITNGDYISFSVPNSNSYGRLVRAYYTTRS